MKTGTRNPAGVAQTLLWMLMGGALTLLLWVAVWEIWPWLAAGTAGTAQAADASALLSPGQLQQSSSAFAAEASPAASGSMRESDTTHHDATRGRIAEDLAGDVVASNELTSDELSSNQPDGDEPDSEEGAALAPGQMYRWRDAHGVLHFSDRKPAADAEIIAQDTDTLSVYEGMSAREIRDGLTPDKPARRKQGSDRRARSSGGPTLVVAMDARCEWTHGRIVALNDLIAQGGNGKESIWQKERSKRCGEWRKYCAEHVQRLRC